jgi:hypothetical protein
MALLRSKTRPRTPLENWVITQFGGIDAKQALCDHAERLVQAAGTNMPPVDVLKLARTIGIDPWPVYEPGTEGAIKIIDGHIRIVLRTTGQNRQTVLSKIGRSRFTYAHELAHVLFYDPQTCPPIRLAPEGFHRLEEQLCNKVASRFLVPESMLQSELSNVFELSPELLRYLADKFQTSIQAMAYRVAEAFASRLQPDRFYMLSANVAGLRGTALEKPRCLICILSQGLLEQGVSLLQSYQGIEAVKRYGAEQSLHWSLAEYFQHRLDRKRGARVESEEVVKGPDGSVLEVKACHRTLDRSSLVWSEGTIRMLRSE